MVTHASALAASLKHYLHKEAGQDPEVFQHFVDGAKNLVEAVHLAEMAEGSTHEDEVENYYNDNDDEDDINEMNLISGEFLEILEIKEGQHLPFDDASTMGGSLAQSEDGRRESDDDDDQTIVSVASSIATERTGGVAWAPDVQDISKKTIEEIIDIKMQDQAGMWEKYVRWKKDNKLKYEVAVESRSTNVTKAQLVYNLFLKDMKKNTSKSATGSAAKKPGDHT
jgi:hypothetical protein